MAKPFYTDGMTVDDILSLSTDTLNKLSKRDMSRALRTVSLAANKRLTRLENQAIKKRGGWVENPNKMGISTQALNWVADSGKSRFGVGTAISSKSKKTDDRNAMYAEFARVRQFMNMKTSTVKGAVSVRKNSEKLLFGKTREEVAAKEIKKHKKELTPSKAKKYKGTNTKKRINKQFSDLQKEIYKNYNKFMELNPNWAGYESGTAISQISESTKAGKDFNTIMNEANQSLQGQYEANIAEYNENFDEGDFLL